MGGIITLIVLFVLAVAALPVWPYSRRWNLVPAGFLSVAWLAAIYAVLSGS
jgi:hypothetical protein